MDKRVLNRAASEVYFLGKRGPVTKMLYLFCKDQIQLSIVNIMETGLVRNCINFNFTTWQEFVEPIPVMEIHSNSDAVKHFGQGYKLVIRSNCRQVAIWGPKYEYNHLNQAELGQLKNSLDIFKEKNSKSVL